MALSRASVPAFIGGTDMSVSRQASTQRTVNFFREVIASEGNQTRRYLRPAECIQPFASVDSSDTSELFSQDGKMFTCTGTAFAEVFEDGSTTVRGTIAYDGSKATMCSNGSAGHQVCIVSAGILYIYNLVTHVFTQVASFQTNSVVVRMCEFMDGYFFALQDNSRRVYYSALEDGLTWDFTFGLVERSWGSDNIQFIKRSGRQLWFVGSRTSEIWADNGNSTIPFAPIQGAFLDIGSIAAFSGVRDGETITWLSQAEQGGGLVVRANGYNPEAVSNYAIASMIQDEANTLNTAEAFVHQLQGHQFYWLHIDGLDTTPTYDFAESLWSERAMWDVVHGVWQPHVARCHCYAFQKNLVGVRTTGQIYELNPKFLTNVIVL